MAALAIGKETKEQTEVSVIQILKRSWTNEIRKVRQDVNTIEFANLLVAIVSIIVVLVTRSSRYRGFRFVLHDIAAIPVKPLSFI